MVSIAVPDGRGPTVRIDRSDAVQRYRYRCPEGHTSWEPTNNHLYCRACETAHFHVLDAEEGERIHWQHVELVRAQPTEHPV